jgi:hypothetical protein
MMSFTGIPGDGEGRLGFVELALKAFAFLLRLGFTVVKRDGTLVRFESSRVFVNVYYGRRSYSVGLELGRILDGDMYTLYEVLSALAPADIARASCQTNDPNVLERCLGEIAEAVERVCPSLLAGDAAAFEGLRSTVSRMREALTIRYQFGGIIKRADLAWDAKDFGKAADLYEKATPGLDETRRRRLEYLLRRREK